MVIVDVLTKNVYSVTLLSGNFCVLDTVLGRDGWQAREIESESESERERESRVCLPLALPLCVSLPFFIALNPRVECYKSLCALNTSPPRNHGTPPLETAPALSAATVTRLVFEKAREHSRTFERVVEHSRVLENVSGDTTPCKMTGIQPRVG